MISRRSLLAALPALASCGRSGSGYPGFAFVASAGSQDIAVVDLLAFSARERIELGASPKSLARHDSRVYALLPEASQLVEIDTTKRRAVRRIELPGAPLSARPQPGTDRLWCLIEAPTPALVPVDSAEGRAGRLVQLEATPLAFALSPTEPYAAVALASGAIQVINLDSGRAISRIQLAESLGSVQYRSDGKIMLIAERGRRLITILEAPSGRIVTQLPLALSPDHVTMNTDGGQLFVTGEGSDAVVIVYPYRTEIAQTSLSGRRPGRMAVSSEPPYLFVSNPEAGSVSVFDITSQKVVAVTGVGVQPGAIAITPDQQYALVLNEGSGDMAVIRIAAITPGREKRAPLFTMVPVGDRPLDIRVVPA